MSQRELIIRNIVETLKVKSVGLGTVTRDPGLNIKDLAVTGFPAVIIESGNEERETYSQGGPAAVRFSLFDVNLRVFITNVAVSDSVRNKVIESIENALEKDPDRGGNAIDTQLISVVTDNSEKPYIIMDLVFQVRYLYQRGHA
jgi:hypothetical protein